MYRVFSDFWGDFDLHQNDRRISVQTMTLIDSMNNYELMPGRV